MDVGIFASPLVDDIDIAINENAHCNIEDQGSLSDYLGINITKLREGVLLSQPQLINQIIKDVSLPDQLPHK